MNETARIFKVKTLKIFIVVTFCFGAVYWCSALPKLNLPNLKESFRLNDVSVKSVLIEKDCLNVFLSIAKEHDVSLLVFDLNLLPNIYEAHQKPMKEYVHLLKNSSSLLHETRNSITFAVRRSDVLNKKAKIIEGLKSNGFKVYVSLEVDPRRLQENSTAKRVISHMWLAKNGYAIHIVFLYERVGGYFWIGPNRLDDWKKIVQKLGPILSNGTRNMTRIGAELPTHAQAFEKSNRMHDHTLEMNGYDVKVPDDIPSFLDEYKNSRFIECNYEKARIYKQNYEKTLTKADIAFQEKAKKLLLIAKGVFDQIKMPFSLSSGTCLGWYRQCDIIPYSMDVDLESLIQNFDRKVIDKMRKAHVKLLYQFGKEDNGLEFSFWGPDEIKLDLFLVFEENNEYWIGGTRASDGERYKYKYPKYKLCWTELLNIKVRVPCNPEKYVEAHYGKNWMYPKKEWSWNKSPPNMEVDGKWSEKDKKEAIQIFNVG